MDPLGHYATVIIPESTNALVTIPFGEAVASITRNRYLPGVEIARLENFAEPLIALSQTLVVRLPVSPVAVPVPASFRSEALSTRACTL